MVLNDYVTAKITYSTAHLLQEVLTWSWATLCGGPVRPSPWKLWLLLHWGYIGETSWLCYMRLCYDSAMAALWLCRGCCCGWCNSLYRDCVMAAVPTRREEIYLQFWRLLTSSSSLLARALPTMGSANGVHSEIQQDSWRCDQDQQYTFSVSVFTYNVRIPIATLGHD